MHCLNVMTGALAPGKDKGATILIGGKRTLKIGDLMGTVVVPFMKLETDEDYEKMVELGQKIIDFFAENALEHERCGEMIERIGLVNFLEGIGIEPDPNMVSAPRTNSYVRMDGWDEEVAKIKRQESRRLKPAPRHQNALEIKQPCASSRQDANRRCASRSRPASRTPSSTCTRLMRKNFGNWKYHDHPRPGVLHHVAHSRRRGLDRARRHPAPDGRLHHPQAVRHRRQVRRRPRPLHHPLQHRVHGRRPEPRSSR